MYCGCTVFGCDELRVRNGGRMGQIAFPFHGPAEMHAAICTTVARYIIPMAIFSCGRAGQKLCVAFFCAKSLRGFALSFAHPGASVIRTEHYVNS